MIEIPAGRILLRNEATKTNWKVDLAAFRLAPFPVTRELYGSVRGEAPPGAQSPVTEVSWNEALEFRNLLSQTSGLEPSYSMGDDPDGQDVVCNWDADGYRLPSDHAAARATRPCASWFRLARSR